MELRALMIVASLLLSLFSHRCGRSEGLFHPAKPFGFIAKLSCIFLSLAVCLPCSIDGMQDVTEKNGCSFSGDNQGMGFKEMAVGDIRSSRRGSSVAHQSSGSVCVNSNLFCFPSKVPGSLAREHNSRREALEVSSSQSDTSVGVGPTLASRWESNKTWSSDSGMFELFNGKTISCSLESKENSHESSSTETVSDRADSFSFCRGSLVNQKSTYVRQDKNIEISELNSLDSSSSPNVKISPPDLDWGQKYLFFPSVAFLTVENSCNDSILHVYEPFSTNKQFYSCNFSEVLLGPGEVASICFVFLPRWLGLARSHLILQTSSGGFLVSAKGFAVESPFKIQPLVDLKFPSNGRLRSNFSLSNALDEILRVEEVTALISLCLGNATHQTEVFCSMESFSSSEFSLLSVKDWLVVRSGIAGSPLMGMRPLGRWDIGPRSSENIIELDFSFGREGKLFGAVCMQLVRSSLNGSDTVMVPLEVDLGKKAVYNDLSNPVSVSLEPLVFDDSSAIVFIISLRNRASHMLNVVSITEVAETKLFQIKYMEGFLLFPGAVTQVGLVTCAQSVGLHDLLPEETNMNENCKLLIVTNDSANPQTEISCQTIHICSRCQRNSFSGYKYKVEDATSSDARPQPSGGSMQFSSQIMGSEVAETDEILLENWKFQGTKSHMFMLEEDEILFSIVQVGTHSSRWIEVKNPSEEPAVVQIILNAGERVDDCRVSDDFLQPPSGSLVHRKSNTPARYGFSMADDAVTEAYIHPYGRASLGPVIFNPSDRCTWRSSILLRNNLSGVEWLQLKGLGGSLSLVLLEESKPVKSLDFKVPDSTTIPEKSTSACSQPLLKELYAKNTGDFPLEVISIQVSGKFCSLDGFAVHTCTRFSLEPGELKKILVLYQTDFSAATVYRDLELTLTTGILVIPMKASLPTFMLNLCKRSVFWMRFKKSSLLIFGISSIFVVLFGLFVHMMALGSQDCVYKSDKRSIISERGAGRASHVQHNHRNSKISVHDEVNCLFRSVTEDKNLGQASVSKGSISRNGSPEQEKTIHHAKLSSENHRHTISFSDTQKERKVPSLSSESAVAENSERVEASQTGNLTVRVGKEKGRRRRKRKGAAAVKAGLLEVSSSQSGNSTPSSPLSPVTSNESRYILTQSADQHCVKGQIPGCVSRTKQPELQVPSRYYSNCFFSTPMQQPSTVRMSAAVKPTLLPSATFPSARRPASTFSCASPSLASTSTIAPHARAPGSNLYNQKTVKDEQARGRDDYTYDIWGNHFSTCLSSMSKDVSMNSRGIEKSSDSFFVRGPQTLVANAPSKCASCFNQEG